MNAFGIHESDLTSAQVTQKYSGILHVIERNDYDVFSRRASLNAMEKAARIPALLWKL